MQEKAVWDGPGARRVGCASTWCKGGAVWLAINGRRNYRNSEKKTAMRGASIISQEIFSRFSNMSERHPYKMNFVSCLLNY